MSPLKRFNKVAPSPVKPSTTATPSAPTQLMKSFAATAAVQPSSLQSSSASLLEEKKLQSEVVSMMTERAGSTPNLDEIEREGEQKNVAKPITLEPVIVVKSKNGDLMVQEQEGKYKQGNDTSTVLCRCH